ncbi:DUF4365 domain-containing protein [Sphaerospermopsis aphanizomenoides BCCUSP55]|uniref:DUF4365 domain-containing protein n=1 Tax=Sphaerospermopsis aphanizomenoides TaxID=459663 RepID=UPI001904DD84|nr:DUF4365 domain-containing protein [Sphaerospermopsis aphanizomenoides]MBK1986112.1 DUF4365 domain-containing protein [Sphaerospermopsis aphanizomenoides BCCUSP55]
MQTEQPWYIGFRSKALAIVSLTERDDLIVYRDTKDYDLDVLVSISKNGEDINRLFGVEIKAVKSTPNIIQNDDVFNIEGADINVLLSRFTKCNFPICLFFFTLDNDNGYYKWILEPVIDNENGNKLKRNVSPEFRKLNNESINNIVDLVNQWYDNAPIDYKIPDVIPKHNLLSKRRVSRLSKLEKITNQQKSQDNINH